MHISPVVDVVDLGGNLCVSDDRYALHRSACAASAAEACQSSVVSIPANAIVTDLTAANGFSASLTVKAAGVDANGIPLLVQGVDSSGGSDPRAPRVGPSH